MNLVERPEMGHIMNVLRAMSVLGIYFMGSLPSVSCRCFPRSRLALISLTDKTGTHGVADDGHSGPLGTDCCAPH